MGHRFGYKRAKEVVSLEKGTYQFGKERLGESCWRNLLENHHSPQTYTHAYTHACTHIHSHSTMVRMGNLEGKKGGAS